MELEFEHFVIGGLAVVVVLILLANDAIEKRKGRTFDADDDKVVQGPWQAIVFLLLMAGLGCAVIFFDLDIRKLRDIVWMGGFVLFTLGGLSYWFRRPDE